MVVCTLLSPSVGLPVVSTGGDGRSTHAPAAAGAASGLRWRVPIAVAHRGASGDAPENTMAAIRLAYELGAEGYETDLHMTRDGEIVLLHDADIRRTTRGWPDDLPVCLCIQDLLSAPQNFPRLRW